MVTEILVLEGEALVQKGDRVKKGDVLIRGVEYDNWQKNEEGIYVPADEGAGSAPAATSRGSASMCAMLLRV